MSDFRTVNDLARETGYTPETIRYDVKQGTLRAERAGRVLIFTEAQYTRALEHYAERRAREAERQP